MHCTSDYPAHLKDLNLNFIHRLKKFGYPVGYSDHSTSLITPSIAVSLGCQIVEKHFTLSRKLKGPDHKASLEPKEFFKMVKNIRIAEKAFGNKDKKITKSERKNIKIARKSIVAKKDILKGEKFSFFNLTEKRTGKGTGTFNIIKLIGRKTNRKYKKNQIVNI